MRYVNLISYPTLTDQHTTIRDFHDGLDFSDAACRQADPEFWFPEVGTTSKEEVATALKMCAECPCRQACADFAEQNDFEFGIWAGRTEQQRHAQRHPSGRHALTQSRVREVRQLMREQNLDAKEACAALGRRWSWFEHAEYFYPETVTE